MTPESTPFATPVASSLATPEATPFATPFPLIDAPASGAGFPWGDAMTALGVVVSLVLLWTRVEKIDLSGYLKTVLSFLNLGLLFAGVIALGWPDGALVFAGVNGLAILATSARLAMQEDDVLARAAAVSRSTKPEMKALTKRLPQNHKVFRYLGPIRTAKLIDHLSDAARKVPEIEAMAPPVAMLWVMDRPEMGKFVRDFDRLMRLWRKPASEAMSVADTVTATAQNSPMSMQEVIDSLIAFAEAFPGRKPDERSARE